VKNAAKMARMAHVPRQYHRAGYWRSSTVYGAIHKIYNPMVVSFASYNTLAGLRMDDMPGNELQRQTIRLECKHHAK
jgi:hypothetical protein